jgi:hypothetical protein
LGVTLLVVSGSYLSSEALVVNRQQGCQPFSSQSKVSTTDKRQRTVEPHSIDPVPDAKVDETKTPPALASTVSRDPIRDRLVVAMQATRSPRADRDVVSCGVV